MNKSSSLLSVLASVTALACAETPDHREDSSVYGGGAAVLTPTKFETVPPGEQAEIDEIIALTTQLLEKRYGSSLARRGVHPKDHGCVKASFTVDSDLEPDYRVGVLAMPGSTYQAWVRFSNATPRVGPDMEPDGPPSRGMAIKLIGVEGKTLLDEPGAKTQDFLLINQPMFAFANVTEYLELTRVLLKNKDVATEFFTQPPPLSEDKINTLKIIRGVIKQAKLGNPLDARYFSASPFLFGKDTVAKFAMKPRNPANTPVPSDPAPDFMRQALKRSLDVADGTSAVFDFQVQLRTHDDLPIENASANWTEDVAPFENVATLSIEKQDFDNPIRITECEHLVFTPWHGLVEYRPIGGINRLRLGVYAASSKRRSQTEEPSELPE